MYAKKRKGLSLLATEEGNGSDGQQSSWQGDQTEGTSPQVNPGQGQQSHAPDGDLQAQLNALTASLAKKEAQIQELNPFEQKIREQEEANKTELEKTNDQLTTLQNQLAEAQLVNERLTLASKYDIPEPYRSFITGDTPEAREASAKLAGELVKQATTTNGQPPSNNPMEKLKPGATPGQQQKPDNHYPSTWKV